MSLLNNFVSTSGLLGILYFMFYSYNLQAALVITLVLIVLKYSLNQDAKLNLPPGPKSFPIFGLLKWFLVSDINKAVLDLHKKYGPLLTIELGAEHTFFVSDYNFCKELGQHSDFQDRPNDTMKRISSGMGIITNEGPTWKHQRRFMMQSLKDFGMGKLNMQDKIIDELQRVNADFDKYEGRPMSVHKTLEKSTFNLICALAFNKQYDYSDPLLNQIIHNIDQNFKLYQAIDLMYSYWWTRPITWLLEQKAVKNWGIFRATGKQIINEHKSTLDTDNPRDFIDLFLMEMAKEKSEENKKYLSTFFEDQLIHVMADLFAAGAETSSTTIRWAILFMSHNRHVQEKVQNELDDVVGFERMPTMEDRQNLPYTVATLQEIERTACVAPAALPKFNNKTVEFKGYTFPPGSELFLNLFAIHRDPNIWKDPEEFKPERFIDANGKTFRPPQLMAFGSGKRSCPGESLARMEIFLYFASLLQRYTFKPANDGDSMNVDPIMSIVRAPKPFLVRAIKRH